MHRRLAANRSLFSSAMASTPAARGVAVAASAPLSARIPCPHRDTAGLSVTPAPLEGFQSITEGSATVLFAKGQVFYNQVQVFNRDLSVAVLRAWDSMCREKASGKEVRRAWGVRDVCSPGSAGDRAVLPPLRILEALSASGLRSCRYAAELQPGRVGLIVANDIEPAACQAIQRNIELNGLTGRGVVANAGDAALVMQLTARGLALPGMEWMGRTGGAGSGTGAFGFDVVDLDPYGSASVFLDGAVQAVAEGGLLAVTCTDMAVLAGNHQDACRAKYGVVPAKGRHFSEQALRIVLGALETAANKYKRSITPLLSVQPDFYLRVFVSVRTSASATNVAPLKLGMIHQCTGCDAFWLWPLGKTADSTKGMLKSAHAEATTPVAAKTEPSSSEAGGDAEGAGAGGGVQTWGSGAPGSGPVHPLAGGAGGIKRKLIREAAAAAREVSLQEGGAANIAPELGHCCPHCGRSITIGGPVWMGPLHDHSMAVRVADGMAAAYGTDGRGGPAAKSDPSLAAYDLSPPLSQPRPAWDGGSNDADTVATSRRRLAGFVANILDEMGGRGAPPPAPRPSVRDSILASPPLYYELSSLCSRIKCTTIPLPAFYAALGHAGYKALPTHCGPNLVKTDAPAVVVADIMRAWATVCGKDVGEGSAAAKAVAAAAAEIAARTGGEAAVGAPASLLAGRAPAWAEALRAVPVYSALLAVGRQSPPASLPGEGLSGVSFEGGPPQRRSNGVKGGGARFVPNPGANWGPKSRAVGLPQHVPKVGAAGEPPGEEGEASAAKRAKVDH